MSVLRLWVLKTIALMVLYLSAPIDVRAQTFLKTNLTAETAQSIIRNYYRAPQPEQIAAVIQTVLSSGLAETRPRRLALIAFMAGLISEDVRYIDRLAPVFARLPDDQSQRLVRAVLYSGRIDWKEQLQRLKKMWPDKADDIDRIAASGSRAVFDLKRDGQPEVLDMNWAFFNATGRREPVMAVVEWLGDLRSGDADKVAMAHAARLSLTLQAIEHERVFDICLHAQWGSFGDHLRIIVAAAQVNDTSTIKAETDAAMRAARGGGAPPEAQILTVKPKRQ